MVFATFWVTTLQPNKASAQATPLQSGLTLLQTQDHVQIGIEVNGAPTFTSYTLHQPERWVMEIPASLVRSISSPSLFLRNHPILQAILISERTTQGSNKIQRWAFVVRSIPELAVKLKPNQILITLYHQAFSTPPNKALVLFTSPPENDSTQSNNLTTAKSVAQDSERILKWIKNFPKRWSASMTASVTLAQLQNQFNKTLEEEENATKTERESNIQWLSDAEGEKLLNQWSQESEQNMEAATTLAQVSRWAALHQQEEKLFLSLQILAMTRVRPSIRNKASADTDSNVVLSAADTQLAHSLSKSAPNLVRRSERLELTLQEESNKVESDCEHWESRWPTLMSQYNQRVEQQINLMRLALAKKKRQKKVLQEKAKLQQKQKRLNQLEAKEKAKLQQKQKRLNQLEAKEKAKANQQQLARAKAQVRARQAKELARIKIAKAKRQEETKALRQQEHKLVKKKQVEQKARELVQTKAKKKRRAQLQKQSKDLARKQAQEETKRKQQEQAKAEQDQKAQQALAKKQAKQQALALLQRRRQVQLQTRSKRQKQSEAKTVRRKQAELRQQQAKKRERLQRKQAQALSKKQEKALAQKQAKQKKAKARQRSEARALEKKRREREKRIKLKTHRVVQLQRNSWKAWSKARPFALDPVVAWSRRKQSVVDRAWVRYQARIEKRSVSITGFRLKNNLKTWLTRQSGLAKASYRWQTKTLPAKIQRFFRQQRKESRWLWFKRRMTVYRWRIEQLRQRRRIAILREKAWMEQQRKRYALAARQQAEARRRKKKNQKKPPTLLDIFNRLVPQKSKSQSENP